MTPDEAERIVNDYGAIIERELATSMVAPESALPYDRATLRDALLTYTGALHRMDALDESIRNALGTGYMYLSSFIPDELADRVRVAEAECKEPPDFDPTGDASREIAPCLSDALAPLRRANDEGSLLLAEFHGFEKGIGARDYRVDEIAERAVAKKQVKDMFR